MNNFLKIFPMLLIVFVAGCTSQPSGTPEQITTTAVGKTGEIKEFPITAKQWEFDPSKIEVNKGDTVRLIITSVDVTHGFGLPQFGVNQVLNPGETVTVEFVADKTGTFTFSCTVPCGAGHSSMRGQLIVR